MKTKLLRFMIMVTLVCGMLTPAAPAAAAPAPAASPESFLNPDGTLKLDGSFRGALDLSGWNVQIDTQRGPIFAAAGSVEASPQAAPGEWSSLGGAIQALNNTVHAIAVSGSNVYIGGDFQNANGLPEADYIVQWDGTTWSALGSNGAGNGVLNGWVRAIAVSGSDVYVGGGFMNVNNSGTVLTAADSLAKWDGSNWSALGSDGAGDGSINGAVRAIAVSGSDVYVGGSFSDVNNQGTVLTAADYLARWDGSNWSALGGDSMGDGALNASVRALAVDGSGNLYAGGAFTDIKAGIFTLLTADYIARWDGGAWHALGAGASDEGALNGAVYALAVSGSDLYVGGAFTDIKAGIFTLISADHIARWDGGGWYALGTGAGNGSLNNHVYAVAVSGTDVYVGGQFTDVNNFGALLTAADRIARWDGSNWSALGSDGAGEAALNHWVRAIGIGGATLYVGGDFAEINNQGALLAAQYLATWDGADWSSPAATFPSGALPSYVNTIVVSGTDVYVGGYFESIAQGATRLGAADYIAKWDGMQWSALGSNGAGDGALNAEVLAIAVSGADVYVGGSFTDVNDNGVVLTAADYIAKWDGANWSALGSNGAGDGALNSEVYAFAVNGTDLYVGGYFDNVNNSGTILAAADQIARWDGTNWHPLSGDGSGDGSLNGEVDALVINGDGNLYVGGTFYDVNNAGNVLASADYIAVWDGSNWAALGSNGAGDGSLNNPVKTLLVSVTDLYVGGDFDNVNNGGTVLGAGDYIVKWDGSNWSALGSNGGGDGSLKNTVYALAISGTNLYVGGWFTDVNNNGTILDAADYIAKWDGANWSTLGSDGAGGGALNSWVNSLAISGPILYAGGCFYDVNNNGIVLPAADYLAAYGIGVTDTTPPAVSAITRASPNPTRAASVDFAVTFSEAVTGVDVSDFTLALTGNITGASVSGVAGSGTTYIVTVSTGSGGGTLRLDVSDDDSILDAASNPLGGTGVGNGDFTSGEAYIVPLYAVYLPVALR